MNLKIDIQKNTATVNEMGQKAPPSYANVTGLTGLWAKMITTGGRELYAAQKINAETEVVFKLRYIAGITTKMFVKYGDRLFNILLVNNIDEKNEWLLLSCKEVT